MLAAGVVCEWAVGFVKQRLAIDDSLDVFAVHGVGGVLGIMLTAVFTAAALGGFGLAEGVGIGRQLGVQAIAVVAVAAWSLAATVIIAKLVQAMVGFRVETEEEIEGLDIVAHGERGYDL